MKSIIYIKNSYSLCAIYGKTGEILGETKIDPDVKLIEKSINNAKKKVNEDVMLRDIAYKRMLGKMVREGEKQEKYEEGYDTSKIESLSKGREESKQMTIKSLSIYIKSKFNKNIETLLEKLTIEKLIEIQGLLYTASSIEKIKELIKE